MTPRSMKCSLGMRDAGIDAMAALNSVFPELLNGLSEQEAAELRHTFGAVMVAVVDWLPSMFRIFHVSIAIVLAGSAVPVGACGPAPREHYARTEERVRERFDSVDSVVLVTLLRVAKVKKIEMKIELAGEKSTFRVDRVFKGRARIGDKLIFNTFNTCSTSVVEKWDGPRRPIISSRQWLIYINQAETQLPPHDMVQAIDSAAYDVKVLTKLHRDRADKPR